MSLKKLAFGIALASILFTFTACGESEDGFALGGFFTAQSHDELFDMIYAEELSMNPAGYGSPEYVYMINEFQYLLTMPGRHINDYLEDFDFLVDLFGENPDEQDWKIIRRGLEDFYYMNDFIFSLLLMSLADSAGLLDRLDDFDFIPLPYFVFRQWGYVVHFESYITTPNGTLNLILR